jgi:hypothetical protein
VKELESMLECPVFAQLAEQSKRMDSDDVRDVSSVTVISLIMLLTVISRIKLTTVTSLRARVTLITQITLIALKIIPKIFAHVCLCIVYCVFEFIKSDYLAPSATCI